MDLSTSIRIVNNSTIVWLLGSSYLDEDSSQVNTIRKFAILEPGETAAVPSYLLDGSFSIKPNDDEFSWSPNKSEYRFSNLMQKENPTNLLPRCRCIASKNHMYCILHIPKLEIISSISEYVIYMMAPLSIENTLICRCHIRLTRTPNSKKSTDNSTQSFMLSPEEKLYLYTVNMSQRVHMEAVLDQEDRKWISGGSIVSIYDPQKSSYDRSFDNVDDKGRRLTISLDYSATSICYREVTLYCSYTITNNTKLRLSVVSGNSRAARQDINLNKNGTQSTINTVMFDQSSIDKNYMLQVSLSTSGRLRSDSFSIDNPELGETARYVQSKFIHLKNESHCKEIVMNVERGVGKLRRTKMVTFTPRIVIFNNTGHRLYLKQHQAEKKFLKLSDQSTEPFYWTEEKSVAQKMCVRFSFSEWTFPFGLNDLTNCVFKLKNCPNVPRTSTDLFVYVSSKSCKGTLCIEFKRVHNPPYSITNKTSYNATIGQVGVDDLFLLEANQSLPFAWLDASKERKLALCIDKKYNSIIDPDTTTSIQFLSMQDKGAMIVISFQSRSNVRVIELSEQKIEKPNSVEQSSRPSKIEELFSEGHRHGHGSLTYRNDRRYWKITGEWCEGRPKPGSVFKIESSEYNYLGSVQISEPKSQTVDLCDFIKTGFGELYLMNGDSYYGNFENNLKQGFGVFVRKNGVRYSGSWKNDMYEGEGSLLENDGSIFQGFFEQNRKMGTGTLYLPNGDCISGEWSGDRISNAVYRRGSIQKNPLGSLNRMKKILDKEVDGQTMDDFIFNPYSVKSDETRHINKYNHFIAENETLLETERRWVTESVKLSEDKSEAIIECTHQLLKRNNPTESFVAKFMRFFTNTFYGIYAPDLNRKVSCSPIFYSAVDDLISAITLLKHIIWQYFRSEAPESSQPNQNFKIILTHHVHNSMYTAITKLYDSTYMDKDFELNQRLKMLSRCSPIAFGIPVEHLPTNPKEVPYQEEIAIFNELSTAKSIQDIISILSRTRESTVRSIGSYKSMNKKSQEPVQISADDITPVLTYIISKSSPKNHCSKSNYVFNWRSSFVDPLNPVMTIITSYSRFYEYIMELNPAQKTNDGVLFTTQQACSRLENVITSGKYETSELLWLPELFSELAVRTIGHKKLKSVSIPVTESGLKSLSVVSGIERANMILSGLNLSVTSKLGCIVVRLYLSYGENLFSDLYLQAQTLLHELS